MTEQSHLTDEELSAHLDGDAAGRLGRVLGSEAEGSADVAAHLDTCASCRAGLAALASARDLVRAPVPAVAPEVRAAALAAALAAARDEAGASSVAVAPAAERPVSLLRRRRVPVVAAAVAGVAAAALALPLALAGSSTGPSSGAARSAAAQRPGHAPSASRPRVPPSATSATGAAAPLSGIASAAPAGGLGASAARGVVHLGQVASVSSLQAEAGALAGRGSAPSDATVRDFERCLPGATRALRARAPVQRLAVAVVGRTPALVYVFGPAAASPPGTGQVAVAAARSGCRVLGTSAI